MMSYQRRWLVVTHLYLQSQRLGLRHLMSVMVNTTPEKGDIDLYLQKL